MAKNSGNTKGSSTASATKKQNIQTRFENDAKTFAKEIANSNFDYKNHTDNRLKQLIRQGRKYQEGSLEKTIQDYVKAGVSIGNGQYVSIDHYNMNGAKSELTRIANLKKIHDDIPKMKKILSERKTQH